MNKKISTLLEQGKIRELDTAHYTSCDRCAIRKVCPRNSTMMCMAHNRKDRRSVYYVETDKKID